MPPTLQPINESYYECIRSIEFARLGYLLANSKLTREDANDVIYECQQTAGWFPLIELSIGDVIERASEKWNNSEDDIKYLAEQACRRVWSKYDDNTDTAYYAQNWALDLMSEYAQMDGITLVEHDADPRCRECGDRMFIEDSGVSHHYSADTIDNIDYDLDADHVAIAE